MKKSSALVVASFCVFALLFSGCSTPMATVSASLQASNVLLTNESGSSAADFLGRRNELPYYSIDGGASVVTDEYERDVLYEVAILEKAAYLYGLAKASGNPDDFLSQKIEELRLTESKLHESFGNTALIAKQIEIAHLTDAVQLAREYSEQNVEFFPSQEDFVR